MRTVLILLLLNIPTAIVLGDLYTGAVASIEWKVHSADAIVLVHATERREFGDPVHVEIRELLKQPATPILELRELVAGWQQPFPRPEGDWALFIRTWDDGPPQIAHVVNLSNPLKASSESALTADGVLLKTGADVLKAIRARLQLNLSMTEVERVCRSDVDGGTPSDHFHTHREGTREDVAPWLGGFRKPADCDFWDSPLIVSDVQERDPPIDEDLWVNKVTVPADEKYLDELLASIERQSEPRDAGGTGPFWPLPALANYPGPETNAAVDTLCDDAIRRNPVILQQAIMLRNYLRFYSESSDPLNQTLAGPWRIVGRTETIDIDLANDRRFLAHGRPIPFPNPDPHRREWWGRGHWIVRDNRLTLIRTLVRLSEDAPFTTRGRRVIFADKPIEAHDDDAIQLLNGPKMTRRAPQDN